MKKIETKEVQKMKLELLLEFEKLCIRKNWKFYMAYGSLIGVVREKGFIPWDDDIDLYMSRRDYEELIKEKSDILGSKYFVQNPNTDSFFYIPMCRLCINGTYRCEKGLEGCNFNKGTFIDIFPLDNAPEDENKRASFYKICRFWGGLIRYKAARVQVNNLHTALIALLKILISGISFKRLNTFMSHKMQKYNNTETHYFINLNGIYGARRESFNKDWFKDTVDLPFESVNVPCPSGFDALLTSIYGNYMERPKEGARKIDAPSYYLD